MARPSPVRLVVALSVAAVLAIFLLYVSVAGGTPSIQPSQLHGRKGEVALVGKVTGSPAGDAHSDGLRFRIRDVSGATSVPVVYTGSVPDMSPTLISSVVLVAIGAPSSAIGGKVT